MGGGGRRVKEEGVGGGGGGCGWGREEGVGGGERRVWVGEVCMWRLLGNMTEM